MQFDNDISNIVDFMRKHKYVLSKLFLLSICFLYLLVLYINFSVTCLEFAPKRPFSYFQPILVAIFVTIATIKVESMPDFYTLAIVLINKLYKETCEEQLLSFDLIGGQNSLLMHVAL